MEKDKIRVLICDDDVDFRQLMCFWLESKGYSAISVSNGEEAIKVIQNENPDIVFMDLHMPILDGVDTIKKIRSFDKDIPIIMISAYVDDPKITLASKYGVSGIFYKGADFKEGLSLLETILRTHKKLKNH
ncbi:MAG: response regulator [Candidatus Omnitrophica bacterium]|nr:response regulator [Candidatus Omnitrophota bacterium]